MDVSAVLNFERVQALETWLRTTNTKLTQVNGQRKYGGPPEGWNGPAPGARCEVFISQIPRDVYEDLLIPLFSSVGPLWEFRLMMNFSGQNRGFAYAKYSSSAVAAKAVRLLHGHVLAPGFRLSVCHSTEKRNLCIEGLPATTRQEHLFQVLRVLAEGVERVSLKTGLGIEGVSAIVGFSTHHAASMAKKILVEAFKKQFALTVSVKWQSTVKPSQDKPQKASKSLMASPLKQPRHIQVPPQPSVLPARPTRRPSVPPGFMQFSGSPQRSHPPCSSTFSSSSSSSSSQGRLVSAAPPVMLLPEASEVTGVGPALPQSFFSFYH